MKGTKEPIIGGRIIETLDLLIKIQNKGIATVFMGISGHCNSIDFRLFAPEWKDKQDPSYEERLYGFQKNEKFDEVHEILRNILKNGESSIPGIIEKRQQEKDRKIRFLAELKSELGEVSE